MSVGLDSNSCIAALPAPSVAISKLPKTASLSGLAVLHSGFPAGDGRV
jgi:hypothetical protein